MKKIITLFSVLFTTTITLAIEEVSLLGMPGHAHITQKICDDLETSKTYEILGIRKEYTKALKKETEKLAKEHCINTDYPLSLDQLTNGRKNATEELAKLEAYNNAMPNSYKSSITYYRKVICNYDQAIQEFLDREKAPRTCSAFFTYSLNRTHNFITTKIAQSDLIHRFI